MKNIVVIGGGTGTYTVLTGLKKYPLNLTAVVAMADNGGSTKILREEFGVLPPGSVRPALVALSNAEKSLADLFNFRFQEGNGLSGHNFGNLFITALTKQLGSFERAIEEVGKILNIKGRVIPSTLEDSHLFAELENGEVIKGEADIDIPKHDGNLKVKKVWLEPADCEANPKALQAIGEASLVVIGPGDLFTSVLPNFLAKGVVEAARASKAKKVYVCNLMTKFGETNRFTARTFVDELEHYIGQNMLDYVLVNTRRPSAARIKEYEKEKAEFVEYNKEDFKGKDFTIIEENLLRKQGFIRHDSDILAKLLYKIATKK